MIVDMDKARSWKFGHRALCATIVLGLAILERISPANGELMIRRGDSYQRVRSRSTANFRCLTEVGAVQRSGTAGIVVEWTKDAEVLDFRKDGRLVKQQSGQLLTISNVSSTDTGVYKCTVRLGDDVGIASVELVVEDVPDPPVSVQLTECDGRVVQLEWRLVRENYSPVIQFIIEYNTSFRPDVWQVAKTQLPRDRTYQRIALSPWGNYSFRVIAQNAVGMSRPSAPTATVCSTPPEVPHINPRGVCTLNEMPYTLVVTWEPMPEEEHNAPGFLYVVRWRKHEGQQEEYVDTTVEKSSSTFRIDGQPVYTPYEILVIARNQVGDAVSPPRMVIGYSGEDVPSVAPQHFRLDPNKAVTDKTADFIWTAVNTGPWIIKGFFRGYKIQFWKTDDPSTIREHSIIYREPGPCWLLPINSRHKREASLGHIYNLWPFTNITAQIRVLNARYEGPPSQPITFSTKEGVPGPVGHLSVIGRGFNLLRLAWEKPTALNGIFLGYTLTYTVVNPLDSPVHNRDNVVQVDEPNLMRLTLKGLLPQHTYRLSISGRTSVGYGPPVVTEARTLQEGPPAAFFFTTTNISKRTLNVTWFMSEHGIPGTVFTVQYRKLGQPAWARSQEVTQRNWTLIEGLEPGVIYEMRVIARNGDDIDSPETAGPVKRVRIGVKRDLIQPTFKVIYPDSSSISISLDEHDPSVDDYYVEYRQLGADRWRATGFFRALAMASIANLIPGSKYEIRVVSRSDLGETASLARIVVIGKDPDAQASVGGVDSGSRLLNDLLLTSAVVAVASLLITNNCCCVAKT